MSSSSDKKTTRISVNVDATRLLFAQQNATDVRPLARHAATRFCHFRFVLSAMGHRKRKRLRAYKNGVRAADTEFSHFFVGQLPDGEVGPAGAGHALALTSATCSIKAGALPSDRVLLRGHRQYYGPLGLPLHTARFRLRLIRVASP